MVLDYPCGPKCNHVRISKKQREIAHRRRQGGH